MQIRLPKDLSDWLDFIRGLKSRQSMIIDILYGKKKECEECTKECKHKE